MAPGLHVLHSFVDASVYVPGGHLLHLIAPGCWSLSVLEPGGQDVQLEWSNERLTARDTLCASRIHTSCQERLPSSGYPAGVGTEVIDHQAGDDAPDFKVHWLLLSSNAYFAHVCLPLLC